MANPPKKKKIMWSAVLWSIAIIALSIAIFFICTRPDSKYIFLAFITFLIFAIFGNAKILDETGDSAFL